MSACVCICEGGHVTHLHIIKRDRRHILSVPAFLGDIPATTTHTITIVAVTTTITTITADVYPKALTPPVLSA